MASLGVTRLLDLPRHLAANDPSSSVVVVLDFLLTSPTFILCKFFEGMVGSYTSFHSYSPLQKDKY